jgi:hypothetical protein
VFKPPDRGGALSSLVSPATEGAFTLLDEHDLFRDAGGVVRLPVLVRGELIIPAPIDRDGARRMLAGQRYAEGDEVQLLCEDILDPNTGEPTGEQQILVLPRVADPSALLAPDLDALVEQSYDLPVAEVFAQIGRVAEHLDHDGPLIRAVAGLLRRTSSTPPAFFERAVSGMREAMNADRLRLAVDRELAWGAHPGSELLDGWVDIGPASAPGLTAQLSGLANDSPPLEVHAHRALRALPTRQLHITAGNSPVVPVISLMRALALKSACLLKLPSGAIVAGSALATAVWLAGAEHPLTRATSIAYWRGGDARMEDVLFSEGAWDRIVVWGAPGSVGAVTARAGLTKTITFNPRYGASLIGAEALRDDFDDTVRRAATDALVWNQQACIASLVQYVEGSTEDARAFAAALAKELGRWETAHPNPRTTDAIAAVRRARRGELRNGEWFVTGTPAAPAAAVVLMDRDFDIAQHPMTRVIVVRPTARLELTVDRLHHAVSQVGVAPESRRQNLRTRICAAGVSAVLPLGEADTPLWAGEPHDSLRPLSELASWVVA